MTLAARRTIDKEWWYTTDRHLPPRAAPDFRSREDPDEHVWEYGLRNYNKGQGQDEANGTA